MPAFSRTLLVELQLDGVWTDVTAYVLQTAPVTITRGRGDEAARAQPSRCALTFNDGPTAVGGGNGRFSPRNPLGAYYGLLGTYTPIRVSVDGGRRFTGEVAALVPSWDVTHKHRVVACTAAGVLRRLEQATAPLPTAMARYLAAVPTAVVAYWPLDETADQQVQGLPAAPSLGTVSPMLGQRETGLTPPTGTVEWGKDTAQPALLRAPQITNGGRLVAWVDPALFGTTWGLYWGQRTSIDSGSQTYIDTDSATFSVSMTIYQDGLLELWLTLTDPLSPVLLGSYTFEAGALDSWHHFGLVVTQIGGSTFFNLGIDGINVISASNATTIAHIRLVTFKAPNATTQPNAVAQVVITTAAKSQSGEFFGHVGETAGRRVQRLCSESGIPFTSSGDLDATAPMGPQRPLPLHALLLECEATDLGLLLEPRTSLGIMYRTRADLTNQALQVTLDYAGEQVAPPLQPVEDDQQVRNSWTVTRVLGGQATAELTTGRLSVQDPPNGAGRRDSRHTVNTTGELVLPDIAGWLVRLGTVDEPRYPKVVVDFAAPAIDNTTDADVLSIEAGDLLAVDNLDAAHIYDLVRLLARGYTEVLRDQYGHTITFTCAPASPYDVLTVDDATLGRVALDGQTVNTSASSNAGSLSVATAAGKALLTTDAADLPMRIRVAGAELNVTAITGASSPQTLTTTLANGVVKTLPAGAPVELASRHAVAY